MPALWRSGSVSGRPKTGSRSIRGTISGPIPMLSSLDDDEFPMRVPARAVADVKRNDELTTRQPTTGSAKPGPLGASPTQTESLRQSQSLGPRAGASTTAISADPALHAGQAEQAPRTPPAASPVPLVTPTPKSSKRQSPSRTSPPRMSPPRDSPLRSELQAEPSFQLRGSSLPTNRPTTHRSVVRYSEFSESGTGQSTQTTSPPQRKKSTFRSALGKLFGRKKTDKSQMNSSNTHGHMSGPVGPSQHRSDTFGLSGSQEEPKRSTSLPLAEVDQPLRSNSVGPDDLMAIGSAREFSQADPERKTAATRTRRAFVGPRRNKDWSHGLSPRPVSSHNQKSLDRADPNEIGRAISSDVNNLKQQRRRSRSLSGLEEIEGPRCDGGRRSDEIRYWRESYGATPLSPVSSDQHEDVESENTGQVSSPNSPAEEPTAARMPPQPFNFGPITSPLAGMKITPTTSPDARVHVLETRIRKLERVVTQLCHSVPGFKSPLGDTSLAEPTQPSEASFESQPESCVAECSAHDLRHSVETDGYSQVSFGDAPTYIGSLHPPSSSATEAQSPLEAAHPAVTHALHRLNSNSTVRGATSMPTMGRAEGSQGSNSPAQYAALVAQLETERAARQTLEAQVMRLSERLNALSTTMFTGADSSLAQPKAPHDALDECPLLAPQSSAPAPRISPKVLRTLSVFQTPQYDEEEKDASVDRGSRIESGHEDEEDELLEQFQTPREELVPHAYGAFGEELREDDDEDDPARKKAARTLSLSQLTLGKQVMLRMTGQHPRA